MKVLYLPFHVFIELPILAAVPAALFGVAFAQAFRRHRKRWSSEAVATLVAAILWLGYTGWELYVHQAYPPESVPIRVDLLLIAPVLWIVSAVGFLVWLTSRFR